MKKTIEAAISTGTYNTSDYKCIYETTSMKRLETKLKKLGYPHSEIFSTTWTVLGQKFTLSINND